MAFGARTGGWPALVFWVFVTGTFAVISMLYIAETSLRTRRPLQLSGLAETYTGEFGSWLLFVAIMVNSLGALIAYTIGSGDILGAALGIPNTLGSLLFFIPAVLVVWLGLRATGASELIVSFGMLLLITTLIIATVIEPGIEWRYLATVNLGAALPIASLVIFGFIAQYTVPELARGFIQGNVRHLPTAIIVGMSISGTFYILAAMAALGLAGPANVTEVATVGWGRALGPWAFVVGNIFTLLAFITSFWAIGERDITERSSYASQVPEKEGFGTTVATRTP